MSGMKMSFWFGTYVEEFLFAGYKITTPVGLILTCLAVMSFAFLFEALKLKVQKLSVKQSLKMKNIMHSSVCPNDCHSSLEAKKGKSTRYGKMIQLVLLYIVQNIMGYLLMLAVMTYNGYFALSVVFGAGVGYLVFGKGFLKLQLKNSQRRENCPACKDQCGKLQQSEGPNATEPRLYAVLEEYNKQENDETGHILETCSC